jgi:hypothetical protein
MEEAKMTAKEIQKRNEKAQNLRVIQVDDSVFYCESEEGKICYKVSYVDDNDFYCTCGDFARGSKAESNFRCKHLLAIMQCIPSGDFETAEYLEKRKPKLDERFITSIEGRDFVYYSGLLDLAHQKGLIKLNVETLQFPSKENDNTAICRAVAETSFGNVFSDIGDANPNNCNHKVARHLLRMASTRAKARCLRDLDNIGITCLEELGDLSEVIGAEGAEKGVSKKVFQKRTAKIEKKESPSEAVIDVTPTSVTAASPEKKDSEKDRQTGNGNKVTEAKEAKKADGNGNGKGKSKQETIPKISSAQANAIANLSRRRGISVEELERMSTDAYGVKVEHLTSADASTFIRQLQQSS